ncbi:hypothetical protein PRIC2_009540 [Phytophthora ramorum]
MMLVPSASLVQAKACTSTQLTQLAGVAATYSSSPDCAGSALDSSINSVAQICAGACMKLVRELQPDTPDCEYDGTNLGESMNTLVSTCDAASSSGSGSNSDSASTAGSTGSSSIAVTDTVPTCSIENVTSINDINSEAATSADCLGSAGAATSAINKTAYCSEDACVAYLTDVESRLPNCTYAGYNIKQAIADTLALCDDPSLTWAPSTTPPATQATTTTTAAPRVTTQAPTVASSASSQTTDTPATKSAAFALKPGASTAAAVLLLALTIPFGNV